MAKEIKANSTMKKRLEPLTGGEFFIIYLFCQVIIFINIDRHTNIEFMMLCLLLITTFGLRRIDSLGRPWQHIFFLLIPFYNIYFLITVLFLEKAPNKH